MTGSASSVLAEIEAEIARATVKFPTWPTDALHAVGVVAEEMGGASKGGNATDLRATQIHAENRAKGSRATRGNVDPLPDESRPL